MAARLLVHTLHDSPWQLPAIVLKRSAAVAAGVTLLDRLPTQPAASFSGLEVCTTVPSAYDRGANCSAAVVERGTVGPTTTTAVALFFNLTCPTTAQYVDLLGFYTPRPYAREYDPVYSASVGGEGGLSYMVYLSAWITQPDYFTTEVEDVCASWRCCAGVVDYTGTYYSFADASYYG